MPSHRVHCYIDMITFGVSFPKLHRALDRPSKIYGRSHRFFFHEPMEAIIIARKTYPNDPRTEKSALLHLEIDEKCSADPEFKKALELKAKQFFKQRIKKRSSLTELDKLIKKEKKQRKLREKKFKMELDKLYAPRRPKKRRRKSSEFSFKF